MVVLCAVATSLYAESRFQANYHGATYVVRKAKSNRPVVILENNKEAIPELASMLLVKLAPSAGQAAPGWVFLDRETAVSNSLTLTNNQSTSLNNELHLKFHLESPLPLKNVFVVVYIETESGSKGCLVQDAGNMKAFSNRTIAFDMNLAQKPGNWTYRVHVFSDGLELRHQLLDPNEFSYQIASAALATPSTGIRAKNPTPYLTFPPRGTGRAKDKVTVNLAINQYGSVASAKIGEEVPKKLAEAVLEAVRNWWFIPGANVKANESFSVVIDLTKLQEWSNQSFELTPKVIVPE